ncbi:hypothetical protein ACFS4T_20435 [Pseudomonas lini]
MVIVNDQFHAGFPCGETPILDEHLLKHFFEGRYGEIFVARMMIVLIIVMGWYFTKNLEEAECNFLSYALHPTIIETHQACVEQKKYSLFFDARRAWY